jgi:amidase
MSWSELFAASALAQAEKIRRGELSSLELTRAYLERIARLNPELSAFVRVHRRRALAQARAADAAARRGGELPPFLGVPTAVKDLNFVRGSVSRFGSRAVWIPSPVDCRTTASLRRAGFVILGKTATSELGAMPVTEPDVHPPTRNPWDTERTSGGSSGGAGAAVAAALVPIAHGSDGAGSIRIPASLCGLYGFKPTRGRVPNAYGLRDPDILYTCGPLARSVEDAAAMLDVLSGQGEALRPALAARPGRLRIRITIHSQLATTHPEIAEAVQRVAKQLESLGHQLEEGSAPEGSVEEFLPVYQRQMSQAPAFLPGRLQPVTRWLRDAGRSVSGATARSIQHGIAKRILDAMGDADLWLTPTVPVETPRVGELRDLPPAEAFARAALLGVYTAPANITGAPAASLPIGRMAGRWPMGAQLTGRIGQDAVVLAVSRQLEEAMPWRGLAPVEQVRAPLEPVAPLLQR